MSDRPALLRVDGLQVAYGPIEAVSDCSLEVPEGRTVAIIGANGAGKTTVMRCLSRLLPHRAGTIRFDGQDIAGWAPHRAAREGILHVPEGRGIIARLSVAENLRMAYDVRPTPTPFPEALARVHECFPRLAERTGQLAGNMSGGEQQMLALSRALINPPRILLVDEPSLGLSPIMVKTVFATLREFQSMGMTILLVEQNARAALGIADRAYILRHGRIVHRDEPRHILANPNLLKSYLGV